MITDEEARRPPAVLDGRGPYHPKAFPSPLHDERLAAIVGAAAGILLTITFATGVLSHLIQTPPGWFTWPSRPAGLYRINQGLHVIAGIALIPVILVKLWIVYPKLFEWPLVRSAANAIERLALLPLIGGTLFLLFTGLGNIHIWRPWAFGFRLGHYWAAYVTFGAMVVHLGAKWATTRQVIFQGRGREPEPDYAGGMTRRGLLATTFGGAAAVALFTAGQTVYPLRGLALLAPRRPDSGPQGFPVNRTAASAGVEEAATSPDYRLEVIGAVTTELSLSLDDLRAMPQRDATLPISCVEGWSATVDWRGVPVRDLLTMAGADDGAEVLVESIQENRRLRTSVLNRLHAADADTLLALQVNGEDLSLDHGFPVRLIAPNRPGVQQTKWVGRMVVS